jgi:SNF2 family DNA or RNA helicase
MTFFKVGCIFEVYVRGSAYSMSMSLIVVDGVVLEPNGDSPMALSAVDVWRKSQTETSSIELEILGYGKFQINVTLSKSKLHVELIVISEAGKLNLAYFPNSDVDYVIIGQRLIPLEKSEIDTLREIFLSLGITLGKPIPLGTCYSLLAMALDLGIAIDFSEELIQNYHPSLEAENLIELALPLYPYQISGVKWLTALYEEKIGGLLCDEMGLGKTAQAFGLIAHAMLSKDVNILIVTPSSLTINWEREIKKFVPNLQIYSHTGANRIFDLSKFKEQKIVLTSFDILCRDKSMFNSREWDMVVCDEAQALKNRESIRHGVVRDLPSVRKYLVTGTPIENSLRDVWSLSEVVRPGMLGNYRTFEALIEDHYSDAIKLSKYLAPLILRREVKAVMSDLPAIVENEVAIEPSPLFANFYEEARTGGLEQTEGNTALALLGRLRQICCYPRLIDPNYSDKHDSKMIRLLEILRAVKETGNDKVIIFSSYTKSLDLLQAVIKRQLGNPYVEVIDGRISNANRYQILDEFAQIQGFAVLCINPQAGGTGLTITSANHVIHFNRQWNPAIEKQATARSYRRGQDKPVFVYKMFYLGTVEEVIHERLQSKEFLATVSLSEAVAEGDNKQIQKALSMSPIYVNQRSGE